MGHVVIEGLNESIAAGWNGLRGNQEFCTSRSLEGLDGISGIMAAAARQLAPIYKAEVRKYNDDLEGLGRLAVRKAFKLASADAKPAKKSDDAKPAKKSEIPDWLSDYIDPLVGPIMKGAADESARIWVPLAIGGLVFIAVVPTFFFWLGRKSKRT